MASGWFFGLNATDDQLVWRTMLGPHPKAVITVSATVHRGGLLVGVSSTENQFGPVPDFLCRSEVSPEGCGARRPVGPRGAADLHDANYSRRCGALAPRSTTSSRLSVLATTTTRPPTSKPVASRGNAWSSHTTTSTRPWPCANRWRRGLDQVLRQATTAMNAYNLGCNPNNFPSNYSTTPNANCQAVPGGFGQGPMLIAYEVTGALARAPWPAVLGTNSVHGAE
jgi:hypothetical protein